jgi:hypothetical protein
VADIHVRPESIHLAARKVEAAGQDWGESVNRLSSEMGAVGDPYGGDELGAALKEMYQAAGPTALTYFTETGFCVVETAAGLNQMAEAYTRVERDTTAQVAKVQRVVDSLGDP